MSDRKRWEMSIETGPISDGDSDDVRNNYESGEIWKEDIVYELTKDVHQTRKDRKTIPTWEELSGELLEKKRIFKLFRTLYPWIFSIGLGIIVAFNGAYITHSADWFGDFRFGICFGHGPVLADRKRCCGGLENYDQKEDKCISPKQVYDKQTLERDGLQWYEWEEIFGQESRSASWGGWIVAFLVYCGSTILWTAVCCFIVFEFAPQAKGSGIPEVKASVSGFDLARAFSPITLLLKSIGLSLVVGAGLALGKEGPLIQVGVCWAHILCNLRGVPFLRTNRYTQYLRDGSSDDPTVNVPVYEWSYVGSAVGVSTAFGAPLGGILFAVEELGSVRTITRRALLLCFIGAFSASFTLKYLNISGSGNITMFSLSTASNSFRKEWAAGEVWIFLFLGCIAGIISSAFIKLNIWVSRRRKFAKENHGSLWFLNEEQHKRLVKALPERCMKRVRERGSTTRLSNRALAVIEGIFIAFLTATTNYPFTRLLKNIAGEAIHALFETCPHAKGLSFGLCRTESASNQVMFDASFSMNAQLIIATFVRMMQTVITFGALVPSGLFIPSLFMGATIGRLVGNMSLLVVEEQHIEPGVFAMVGAAAMLGGFTRLTVSLVVIMFELTGELTYVIPFMCSVIASKVVGDLFTPSIYEAHATLSGFANIEDPPTSVRLEVLVADLSVDYPWERVLDVDQYLTFAQLQKIVGINSNGGAAVLDEHDSGSETDDEESTSPASPGARKETRKKVLSKKMAVSKDGSNVSRRRKKRVGDNPLNSTGDEDSDSSDLDRQLENDNSKLLKNRTNSINLTAGQKKFSVENMILVRRGVGPIFGVIRKRRLRQWVQEMMQVEDMATLEERYCCFAIYGGGGIWAESIDSKAQGLARFLDVRGEDSARVQKVNSKRKSFNSGGDPNRGSGRPEGTPEEVGRSSSKASDTGPPSNMKNKISNMLRDGTPARGFDKEKGRFTKMGVVSPSEGGSSKRMDRRLVVVPAEKIAQVRNTSPQPMVSRVRLGGNFNEGKILGSVRRKANIVSREGIPPPQVLGKNSSPSLSASTQRRLQLDEGEAIGSDEEARESSKNKLTLKTPNIHSSPNSSSHFPVESPALVVDVELEKDELLAEDISFLVDTHIAKLSMDASLLTLFCVFHQNPELRYVVCSSKNGTKLGVISRLQFITALCECNFAQPPIHLGMDDNVPRQMDCLPFFGQPHIPGSSLHTTTIRRAMV